MMNICGQCGGAIMTPGLSYGYAGQVCMCSWRTPVTPMPQAQIDEALVLAMEADKREIERLQSLNVERIMLDVIPDLDGMPREVYAKSLKDVEDKLSDMGLRLEDLDDARNALRKEIERLRDELAASQAREKVRVEALEWYAISEDGNRRFAGLKAAQALALPADDTALRQERARAQEEMRERCIEEVRGVGGIDAIEVERLIRALEVKP